MALLQSISIMRESILPTGFFSRKCVKYSLLALPASSAVYSTRWATASTSCRSWRLPYPVHQSLRAAALGPRTDLRCERLPANEVALVDWPFHASTMRVTHHVLPKLLAVSPGLLRHQHGARSEQCAVHLQRSPEWRAMCHFGGVRTLACIRSNDCDRGLGARSASGRFRDAVHVIEIRRSGLSGLDRHQTVSLRSDSLVACARRR